MHTFYSMRNVSKTVPAKPQMVHFFRGGGLEYFSPPLIIVIILKNVGICYNMMLFYIPKNTIQLLAGINVPTYII